jgi:diguanylate cyclase (GGDEF)-like protein/PAS domain S-box-containing protein
MADTQLEQLKVIARSSDEAFVLLSHDAMVDAWNPAAEVLLGYSETEILGSDTSLILGPIGASRLHVGLDRLSQGGRTERLKSFTRAKNGRRMKALMTLSPVHDRRGALLGASLVIRRASHSASPGSDEARFSAVIDGSDGSSKRRSVHAVFTSWNAGAEHLFGYADYEMIDNDVSILVPRDLSSNFRREMRRILTGDQIDGCTCLRLDKPGNQIATSATLSPVRDEDGRVVGLTGTARSLALPAEPSEKGAAGRAMAGDSSVTDAVEDTITTGRHALAQGSFPVLDTNDAESQRQRGLSHWQRAFDLSPIPTEIIAIDRRPLWVNNAFARMLGYSRERLVNLRSFAEVTHPDDMARDDKLFSELLAGTRRACKLEKQYVRADGHLVPARLFSAVIRDESGSILAILAQAVDLSAQRRADAEHRRAERFSQLAFDQSPIATAILATDRRPLWVNDAYVQMLGYTRKKLLGLKALVTITHPEDVARDNEIFGELLAGTRQTFVNEKRYLHADGHVVPARVSVAAMRDESGSLVSLLAQAVDLTEERRAQEQRRHATRFAHVLFEQSFIAAAAIDLQGSITTVNDTLVRLSGFSRDQLVGSAFADHVHPDDVGALEQGRAEYLAGSRDSHEFEIRLLHGDGHVVPTRMYTTGLHDDSGTLVGFIAQILDLTEQKKAEVERERATRFVHSLFEQSPIPTATIDVDGRLQLVNDAFSEVLGCSRAELIGTKIADRMYPDDVAEFSRLASELVSGALDRCSFERRYIHADGHVVPGRLYATTIRDDSGAVVAILGQFLDESELWRVEEQLAYEELHDPLTSLPTRRLVVDRIGQEVEWARVRHRFAGVVIVDLDRFDAVNETFGRALGDQLLAEFGRRLVGCSLRTDTVGRLESDTFIVLRGAVVDPLEMVAFANEVRAAIDRPFVLDTEEAVITVSIGIALSGRDEPPERLIRDAELALTQAKADGGNCSFVFDETLRFKALARANAEAGLRKALTEGEFVLYYQPIIDLKLGRFVGTEALIRWIDPDRGLVSPDEFIPVAEETGLIVPIGEWVTGEACRQVSAWNRERPDAPWEIAINVSPQQIRTGSLLQTVTEALDSSGLDPKVLTLELTETTFVENIELVHQVLDPLHRLGVKFAIDDFGTGYSSLGRIRRFDVDILKIDRSFVSGLEEDESARRLASAILELGRALDVTVIAEGVETKGQFTWLDRAGCRCAQGFYFSKPLPAKECFDLLNRD